MKVGVHIGRERYALPQQQPFRYSLSHSMRLEASGKGEGTIRLTEKPEIDKGHITLGRTRICDGYLFLSGKPGNKTIRGTYHAQLWQGSPMTGANRSYEAQQSGVQ